jgi:hypothetical protein
MTLFSRELRRQQIETTFADPASIADALGDVVVPADIASWLGRLLTLSGVPFYYLVPDEAMLPPESIRFFRLNESWIRALLDGAFSLGRNLTADAAGASANLDRALLGPVAAQAKAAAPLRPRVGRSGAATPAADPTGVAWTGFLMRSRVVSEHPGLGVNAYEKGSTPDDPSPVLMPVRRLDRLGPGGDTLLCLVEGDAYRVDVHEAPELLHYGIDEYQPPGANTALKAVKKVHTFTIGPDGTINLSKDNVVSLDIASSFRTRSPRVLRLTSVASAIAAASKVNSIDAAEMGFEMTEGVGMVSFLNRDAP